jgi:probable metal-binding protein
MSTITNPSSVHGHDVIDLIRAADPALSPAELARQVRQKFGDAVFHTCSGQNMSLKQLLELLVAKNKITLEAGVLRVNEDNVCRH